MSKPAFVPTEKQREQVENGVGQVRYAFHVREYVRGSHNLRLPMFGNHPLHGPAIEKCHQG